MSTCVRILPGSDYSIATAELTTAGQAVQIVGAAPNRRSVTIIADGDNTNPVYVCDSQARRVTALASVKLKPGASLTLETTGAVQVFSVAGAGEIVQAVSIFD